MNFDFLPSLMAAVPKQSKKKAGSDPFAVLLADFFVKDLAKLSQTARTESIGSKSIRIRDGKPWIKDFFSWNSHKKATPAETVDALQDLLQQLAPFYRREIRVRVKLPGEDGIPRFLDAVKRFNAMVLAMFDGKILKEYPQKDGKVKYVYKTDMAKTTVLRFEVLTHTGTGKLRMFKLNFHYLDDSIVTPAA
jgi:hypothetical protein